jgi:hypothetical protein
MKVSQRKIQHALILVKSSPLFPNHKTKYMKSPDELKRDPGTKTEGEQTEGNENTGESQAPGASEEGA